MAQDKNDILYYFSMDSSSNEPAQCCICGKYVNAGHEYLENHLQECDYNIFITLQAAKNAPLTKKDQRKSFLWHHLIPISGISGKYECKYCGKSFERNLKNITRNVGTHMMINHKDKFNEKQMLELNHSRRGGRMNERTNIKYNQLEKRHKCSYCDERFPFESHKRNHEARHNGKYKLFCDFEGCTKGFNSPKELKRHSMVHTNERPFQCEFCASRFKARIHLKTHTRVHTGETPFMCAKCGNRFKFAATRDNHKCVIY